jgi:ABC-2 type transport system ATP-binding protein
LTNLSSNIVIVKAENLVKSFGTFRAVDGLSLSINRGEVFGFLGPNGAGKTTSIKMLCGLLRPDSGQIQIASNKSYQSIGVCPQSIVIWENMSCIEQLVFMGELYGQSHRNAKKNGMELLDVLGLASKTNCLAKTLSGGMQRRLNIALALIHEPEILILDEPQAGLDPQSRLLVREYINSIKSKITIILTTHDMDEAEKLSDRICIIDHGKALITGTVDEIRKSLGKGDIFEIEIDGKVNIDLMPLLKTAIKSIRIDDEHTVAFVPENSRDTILEVMTVVKSNNIVVRNFKMRSASLEDVFINLTGRRLRE